jgi:hypothetical protein
VCYYMARALQHGVVGEDAGESEFGGFGGVGGQAGGAQRQQGQGNVSGERHRVSNCLR